MMNQNIKREINPVPDNSANVDATVLIQYPAGKDMSHTGDCQSSENHCYDRKTFATPIMDPHNNRITSTDQNASIYQNKPHHDQTSSVINQINHKKLMPEKKENMESQHRNPTTTNPKGRKALNSSKRRSVSSNENLSSRNCYEYHWRKLAKFTASECSNLQVAKTYDCIAVRPSTSAHKPSRQKCWASMIGGGMVGTYDTKEEAIKRAVCAAIVTGDFENPYAPFTPSNKKHRSSLNTQSNKIPKEAKPHYNENGSDKVHSNDSSTPNIDETQKVNIKSKHYQPNISPNHSVTTPNMDESSFGKPKACEMSDPVSGQVLRTFRSCSEAERVTNISRTTIGKACREGGGLVDGKLFRFVYTASDNIKNGCESIQVDSVKKMPSNVEEQQNNEDISKGKKISSNSTETLLGLLPYEEELNQSKKTLNENIEKEYQADSSSSFYESNNESDRSLIDVHPIKNIDRTTKSAISCPLKSSPDAFFDVSKLQPVYSRLVPGSKKRLIELICRGTGNIRVCFRGFSIAAKALNIDKATVKKMCETQGIETDTVFPSYKLRYASKSSQKIAYEFGSHKDDGRMIDETKEQRMQRWNIALEQEKLKLNNHKSTVTDLKNDNHTRRQMHDALLTIRNSVGDQSQLLAANEVTISSLGVASTTLHPRLPVTLATKPISMYNDDMKCIVCQQKESQIVFEPCSHFVLCEDCAKAEHCKNFCPICRMPILSKSQPSFIKRVQPRIYSANSFL